MQFCYLARKLFTTFITLLLISLFTFAAFHIIPGDPALLFLGTEATAEQIEQLHQELGLNENLSTQYINWIKGMLHSDCGYSLKYKKPVTELLASRIPVTLIMATGATFVIILFGFPLGIYSAYKKNSFLSHLINVFSMITISIPEFFLSVLVIWFFGLTLHAFTPGNYVSYNKNFFEFVKFIIFPICTIAIPQIAILTKYVRSAFLEELSKPYVRTAKSKGCPPLTILFNHVLRNALVCIMPLVGMILANIFTGSIIVEQVFGIPGIGRLIISSVSARDFPLTQALVLYIAFIIVLVNLFVDIAVQIVDPRIRLKESRSK